MIPKALFPMRNQTACTFVLALVLALVLVPGSTATPSFSAATTAAPDASRPNIVFFLIDDMGYMDIGANNPETFYETPHINRLAATGTRFTQATLPRQSLFWHYPHYANQGGYKLIQRFEDGRVHLYNLTTDIGERHDLAGDQPDQVRKMTELLHGWYLEVDAKFLRPKTGDGPLALAAVG